MLGSVSFNSLFYGVKHPIAGVWSNSFRSRFVGSMVTPCPVLRSNDPSQLS